MASLNISADMKSINKDSDVWERNQDFKKASARLESFEKMPWSLPISEFTTDLADAGFKNAFSKTKDGNEYPVECVFCGVTANGNDPKEPFLTHMLNNPYCEFLNGVDVGNIPMNGKPACDPVRGLKCYRKYIKFLSGYAPVDFVVKLFRPTMEDWYAKHFYDGEYDDDSDDEENVIRIF